MFHNSFKLMKQCVATFAGFRELIKKLSKNSVGTYTLAHAFTDFV